MKKRLEATEAIAALVEAGDVEATLAALVAIAPAERAGLRSFAREIAARFPASLETWEGRPRISDADATVHVRRRRAAVCVVIAAGDRGDVMGTTDQSAIFLRAIRELRPDCARSLATDLVANGATAGIRLARPLVAGGLSDHPTTDDYVLAFWGRGLIPGLDYDHGRSLVLALLDDPDHLVADVERLFEVEGTSELGLASHDKYSRADQRFEGALLELTREGLLPRDRMIDLSLATLGREWPAFRSGWFSRFHDALEPAAEELAPREATYRALLGSTIPATVAMAVEALSKLDASAQAARIDRERLVDDLLPVMTARAKGTTLGAIRLLARVAGAEPRLARRVTHVAARGLAHAASEVHRAVLGLLDAHGQRGDDELRAICTEGIDLVAASLRKRAAAWTTPAFSASEPAAPAGASPAIEAPRATASRERTAPEPIAPITDPDDLARRLAGVLERSDEALEIELVLDGVARLGADQRFAAGLPALRKRARMAIDRGGWESLVRFEVARLVIALLDGDLPATWRVGPQRPSYFDALDLVTAAITETAALARDPGRRGLPRLSSPTEHPAYVDPIALVHRALAYEAKGATPGLRDAEVALLRLPPPDARRDEARALATSETARMASPFGVALRYALGASESPPDDLALRLAASRARDPDADDPRLGADHALGAGAGLVARHTWTMAPYHIEEHTYPGLVYERTPAPPPRDATDDVSRVPLVLALHRGETSNTFTRDRQRFRQLGGEHTTRWLALAWPRHLDLFFVEGAVGLTGNLVWGSAHHHHRHYIEPLLWPTTAWTEPALVLLAVALDAKRPDESGLAVEVVVRAGEAGRLDPLALGAVMARMRSTGVILLGRWAKSLATAARVSPHSRENVMRILERALAPATDEAETPAELPRDLARLLDLLHELRSEAPSGPLPTATRAWLQALPDAGKLEKLKRDLLG